jgi:hypothetical protein
MVISGAAGDPLYLQIAQKSMISSPVTVAPGLTWMNAAGTST